MKPGISALIAFGLYSAISSSAEAAQKSHITVSTLLVQPYMQRIDKNGVSKYEGFLKDVLDILSEMLGFSYIIREVPDGKYGAMLENGSWNGLIGDILRKNADLIAAPLTNTAKRQKVADFSPPFQTVGLSILMRKPRSDIPSFRGRLFRLFEPMSYSVWLMTLIAFLATGTVLYVISYYNPYEWRRMAVSGNLSPKEKESFSCLNSYWFSLSTLAWQGYDKSPKSVGGRIVAAIWWLFVILFLLTYTASLTNMIRMGSNVITDFTAIRSLKDLVLQSTIKYGVLSGGSTSGYLENSRSNYLRRLWDGINSDRGFFVGSIQEGIDRVRSSRLSDRAFIMESTMAKYYTHQLPCDLLMVSDTVTTSVYAFGYRPGWNMSNDINVGLLTLRENGQLNMLEEKWWAGKCSEDVIIHANERPARGKFTKVNLASMSGALILLALGLVLGGVVTLVEILTYYKIRKAPSDGTISERDQERTSKV